MPERGSSARLFIALDLPTDARRRLVAWRDRALGGQADLRLVDPEALHVTLVFLGHLPEERIDEVAALVRASVPDVRAPELSAKDVKPVPTRRPRLFAVDLADAGGRATQIHAEVAGACEDAHLYEPEPRPFWPHVTLARVRKGAVVRLENPPAAPADPWHAEAVTLYRSRLSPQGARYEPVERVQLPQ